ncbi:MAG: hypothetical protein JSU81_00945 [Candidatus Coatesbacteria bacterium]|nr:MAG: hypothetical protein JSU81_00945 [Candidatus Coatesbacteria bacterium]
MRSVTLTALATLVCLGGAGAADVAGPAWGERSAGAPLETDGRLELKWDNGLGAWVMCWYTGADSWVGNDFDISTLGGSWWIETIRVMSTASWPNGRWDGFRLGVYAFAGSLPGSRFHGPLYVRGGGSGYRWCDFDFGMWVWSLLGHKRFVVSLEQYYNYPACDPYVLDNNRTFQGHSWQYQGGRWEPLVGTAGYRNLMVRVVISDLMAVTPASLGRVKALYK